MIIYKITNTVNGKIYVGKTTRTLERRWQEHRRASNDMPISRAIRKYGTENFKAAVIYHAMSEDDLNALEKRLISELQANNPSIGYNVTEGGDGFSGHTGKPHTAESRQKISQACRGLKRTETTKHKIAVSRTGKPLSNETCFKISESKTGLKHPLYGRKHSPETIGKMRLSALARWGRER